MNLPKLSVIIPTLNEADHLSSLLEQLLSQKEIALEILVCDGGSTDGTCSIAETFKTGFVNTERGRGRQMNAAARQAAGDYLMFLHADSGIDDEYLLYNALRALIRENERRGGDTCAGHFCLQFIRSNNSNANAFRYAEEKSAFNRPGTTSGDQGLLLTRACFDRLGGFDETLPFLEDQRMADTISACGSWMTLPGYLKTSARRFEKEGFHRRYILMSMIMGLYHAGVTDFFVRAPGVYRTQHETGKLLLTPFLGIIRDMMRNDWGLGGTMAVFYRLGRYIRQNSWQMFYFVDILARPVIGPRKYPCMRFHDRVFGPLTNFRLFDAITGLLCFIWFMGILAAYFRVRDHNELSSGYGPEPAPPVH